MLTSDIKDYFFTLIRMGIGHATYSHAYSIDWEAIESLAAKHGLSAILVDGIGRLPESHRPPKPILLQWIGDVLQGYEYRYDLYCQVIAEIASWYNSHDFQMMILKGYTCSLNWPKPEHRPCGDIDIWLFGKQKEADALLSKEKGLTIDNSHHHHTVFTWRDFMVENHYDFLNIHHHKSNVEIEAILKELGKDDTHYIELHGVKAYVPSPNLHSLFLLRHSMSNFASTGFQLRQLLDWGLFVEKHGKEIDWKWLEKVLEKYGMRKLYDVFNAICVEDLGFDAKIFPQVQFKPILKERVLNDILSPEFSEIEKGGFVRRAIYKYRRWKANAWKHELCFSESMWSAFWSGVKSHLLKPSSI